MIMIISRLFSIFDPSTFIFSFNWTSTFIFVIFSFSSFWCITSNYNISFYLIINSIFNEIKTTLGKSTPLGRSIFILSIFIFILWNNFIGLFPYIFTSSSHISLTFSLAITFWISLIIYSWVNYVIFSLAHLVPQGTPFALIIFIVLIERIRQVIRPLTLAVRLMANIIAGHLLITLVGNIAASSIALTFVGSINAFLLLSILEIAVSIIQAYVFTILLTLYARETNDH